MTAECGLAGAADELEKTTSVSRIAIEIAACNGAAENSQSRSDNCIEIQDCPETVSTIVQWNRGKRVRFLWDAATIERGRQGNATRLGRSKKEGPLARPEVLISRLVRSQGRYDVTTQSQS
jgi:hypothetical protein